MTLYHDEWGSEYNEETGQLRAVHLHSCNRRDCTSDIRTCRPSKIWKGLFLPLLVLGSLMGIGIVFAGSIAGALTTSMLAQKAGYLIGDDRVLYVLATINMIVGSFILGTISLGFFKRRSGVSALVLFLTTFYTGAQLALVWKFLINII